jgi:hypothetical protein
MFCPYCQHPVVRHQKLGDDDDHRWCFIHLLEHKLIGGTTAEEMHASYYALCEAHQRPKVKPRKVKLTHEQRTTTDPGPLKW